MSIRVYELSKKFELTNKEMISFLKDLGVDVSSHVSVVPEEFLEIIEQELKLKAEKTKSQESSLKSSIKNSGSDAPQASAVQTNTVSPQPKSVKSITKTTEVSNNNMLSQSDEKTILLKPMTLVHLADAIKKPLNEIISLLLKQGIVTTKNQTLSNDAIKKIADFYGFKTKELKAEPSTQKFIKGIWEDIPVEGTWVERMPVVVVIGHVDHGKTTLLDYIRKTKIAAKEKGGITQHLGAYEVDLPQGKIVFLDTPGHEAFSLLRMRGAKAADIAVLVVAADDGVMPQTIEAIKHAKSVDIPIIVAINKIDKVGPQQIEAVKQQLIRQELVLEEWGGTTIIVPISAKTGAGVDELLDVLVLQSQVMELKANLSVNARGYVLESKLEKGLGPVATVICQHGKLKIGDFFFAGNTKGKINSIVDSYGKKLTVAGPSVPVKVSGFEELPQAGDLFAVVSESDYKKGEKPSQITVTAPVASKTISEGKINLILKSDNASSKEALVESIGKLSAKFENKFNIIASEIGDVNESDITLASNTKSTIYTFHVRAPKNLLPLAQTLGVYIKHFDIIYKLLEELEAIAEAAKPIKMISKKVGEALVLKVFEIKNIGVVAGAQVKSGKFVRDGKVIVWRNKQKIGEGKIKSLERDRKPVKEVQTGFECAFLVDGFDAWQVDDKVECYQEIVDKSL
jgi:translation initiation factor IF-2